MIETTARLINDLREVDVFRDLPEDQLAWFAGNAEESCYQPGEVLAREGEPIVHLTVILEGEIRIQLGSGSDTIIIPAFAGQVTGLLPYSRLTNYSGGSQAVFPTRIANLNKALFPEFAAAN